MAVNRYERKRKSDGFNEWYPDMPLTQPDPPKVIYLQWYERNSFLNWDNGGAVAPEDLNKKLEVEASRLIDQVVVPLTHSGTKILHIGVDPLNNFKPAVRITCPTSSCTMTMDESEFRNFMARVCDSVLGNFDYFRDSQDAEEEEKEKTGALKIVRSCSHVLLLMPNNNLQIRSKLGNECIYLAMATVLRLVNLSGYLYRQGFDTYRRKQRDGVYPPLDQITTKIVEELEATDMRDPLEHTIFTVLHRDFDDNPVLYELYFNFYYTLKDLVYKKLNTREKKISVRI